MANIDVSEVINDPDFTEPAFHIFRSETIDQNGYNQVTETRRAILVIPTSGDGDVSVKRPEGRSVFSTVRFYTEADLKPGEEGRAPDEVEWRGNRYEVLSRSDWSTWGRGFTSAACQLLAPSGGKEVEPVVPAAPVTPVTPVNPFAAYETGDPI